VSSTARTRSWSMKARIAVTVSTIGVALVIYALIVALVIHPPPVGWVGFGIVSIMVLGLGGLSPLAFEFTRVSPQRPATARDARKRLLVVADPHCSETALGDEIAARLAGPVDVHLVVPVRVSHLHFLTDDEFNEAQDAEQSMLTSVGLLRQRGVSATGSLGRDKPLESMTDALGSFPANDVLLATPPDDEAYWLEHDLLEKASRLTAVPVRQMVVPVRRHE
jgi:hypothetical protein